MAFLAAAWRSSEARLLPRVGKLRGLHHLVEPILWLKIVPPRREPATSAQAPKQVHQHASTLNACACTLQHTLLATGGCCASWWRKTTPACAIKYPTTLHTIGRCWPQGSRVPITPGRTHATHVCTPHMQDQHARDETGSAREGLGATYLHVPHIVQIKLKTPCPATKLPHTKRTTLPTQRLSHATLEPIIPGDRRPGGPLQIRKVCCRANWQSKTQLHGTTRLLLIPPVLQSHAATVCSSLPTVPNSCDTHTTL